MFPFFFLFFFYIKKEVILRHSFLQMNVICKITKLDSWAYDSRFNIALMNMFQYTKSTNMYSTTKGMLISACDSSKLDFAMAK